MNNKAFRVSCWAGLGGHGVASFQSVFDDCEGSKEIGERAHEKSLKRSDESSLRSAPNYQNNVDTLTLFSLPPSIAVFVHLIFATIFFGNGAFYSYYSMRLDQLLPKVGTPRERFLRKLFCWGTFTQFCTVCVVFPIIVIIWGSTDFLTFLIALLEV